VVRISDRPSRKLAAAIRDCATTSTLASIICPFFAGNFVSSRLSFCKDAVAAPVLPGGRSHNVTGKCLEQKKAGGG
jgi:hypothetical protein